MTAVKLYSTLDLGGLPLVGIGASPATDSAVTVGQLEARLDTVLDLVVELEAQVGTLADRVTALELANAALAERVDSTSNAALESRVGSLESRDRVVVAATDPGVIRGLWVQTGLGADGSEMTLWVKEGQ